MKLKHLFFLPLLVMLGAGCIKHTDDQNPVPTPTGTFTGKFLRLRKNAAGTGYDSLKADLTLTLGTTTGFAITGDTSAHAGSLGNFGLDPNYFLFDDKTKASSKVHLNGYYQYAYDGTNLALQATYADTLGLFYTFKKN